MSDRCCVSLLPLAALLALSAAGCGYSRTPSESDSEGSPPHVQTRRDQLVAADGQRVIDQPNTVVNRYTALAADAGAGASSITVASVAALSDGTDALAAGDLLLVVQMQGATIDTVSTDANWGRVSELGSAGLYEFIQVQSVNLATSTIGLSCALKNAYVASGRVQVIRVPQFTNLTVLATGSIVAPPWNGTTGGVVAVRAENALTLNGSIDVSARGFRGGAEEDESTTAAVDTALYASADPAAGGLKGESIAGLLLSFGRGAPANAGGGGNAHNAGGGGGANARAGMTWTGQGVFDLNVVGGARAWPLDPNYSAVPSPGGGRGGYTYSAYDLESGTVEPGHAAWGGNARRERGGLGGRPLDSDPASRLFFGGGGGAGDANDAHGGRGGAGGGLVIVLASTLAGTGQIVADGAPGVSSDSTLGGAPNGDAPGGGGGGGSIVVRADSATGVALRARGGRGGSQSVNNGTEAEGPGGGGGGGYVAASAALLADVAGGIAGTTTSSGLTEFPNNGATAGAGGVAAFGVALTSAIPLCSDVTAPDTVIVTYPTNPSSDRTASFTFDAPGEPAARFECAVDGAPFAPCARAFTTEVLPDGVHRLDVRAMDVIGNADPSPASYVWVVNASGNDRDGDGLDDADEEDAGTDPDDADSDDDGAIDGVELSPGTDSDGDGLQNGLDPDSDDDGLFDGTELGEPCTRAATDVTRGFCVADADAGITTTSPVDADTDDGSLSDGSEDHDRNGSVDPGETDPTAGHGADDASGVDTDADGIGDDTENGLGSDPNDADTDEDGLLDGDEPNPSADHDGDGSIGILDPDSDGDGLFDGTEAGKTCAEPPTLLAIGTCIADVDEGQTVTHVVVADTDRGGVNDGDEDADKDGARDDGERDPLDPGDDTDVGGGGAGGVSGAGGAAGGAGAGAGGSAGRAEPSGVVVLGGGCRSTRGAARSGLVIAALSAFAWLRRRRSF